MRGITALLTVAAALAAFLIDMSYFDSAGITFLGKGLFRITEWLAFWR